MSGIIIGKVCYDTSCPCNDGYVCRKYNQETDACACEEGYEGELENNLPKNARRFSK